MIYALYLMSFFMCLGYKNSDNVCVALLSLLMCFILYAIASIRYKNLKARIKALEEKLKGGAE